MLVANQTATGPPGHHHHNHHHHQCYHQRRRRRRHQVVEREALVLLLLFPTNFSAFCAGWFFAAAVSAATDVSLFKAVILLMRCNSLGDTSPSELGGREPTHTHTHWLYFENAEKEVKSKVRVRVQLQHVQQRVPLDGTKTTTATTTTVAWLETLKSVSVLSPFSLKLCVCMPTSKKLIAGRQWSFFNSEWKGEKKETTFKAEL